MAAESVTDSDAELEHPQGLVEALWGRIPMLSLQQPGWHCSVECLMLLLSPDPGFGVLQNHGLCFNQVVALVSEIGTCCRLFVAAVLCGMEEGQIRWFIVKAARSFSCMLAPDFHRRAVGFWPCVCLRRNCFEVFRTLSRRKLEETGSSCCVRWISISKHCRVLRV